MALKLLLLALMLGSASIAVRAADVGVSISVGEPGYYGRIDIGDYPRPQLMYSQPRMIRREAAGRQPIYLHVPPTHARNWRRYCATYDACDERAYFVRDRWYNNEYVPRYQERHRHRHDDRHDGRRDDHRGNYPDPRDNRDNWQRDGSDRGPYR